MRENLGNALLIHNPNAGNGGKARRRLLDQVRSILSRGGIEAELQETQGPGDATVMAQRAAATERSMKSSTALPHKRTATASPWLCSRAAPPTSSPKNCVCRGIFSRP